MNAEMLEILHSEELSREEKELALERLQKDTARRPAAILAEEEKFAPAVQAYRDDVEAVRKRELEFAEEGAEDVGELTAQEQRASSAAKMKAAAETRSVLLSVLAATSAAESLQAEMKTGSKGLDKTAQGAAVAE